MVELTSVEEWILFEIDSIPSDRWVAEWIAHGHGHILVDSSLARQVRADLALIQSVEENPDDYTQEVLDKVNRWRPILDGLERLCQGDVSGFLAAKTTVATGVRMGTLAQAFPIFRRTAVLLARVVVEVLSRMSAQELEVYLLLDDRPGDWPHERLLQWLEDRVVLGSSDR
jgi:hypothetical protein